MSKMGFIRPVPLRWCLPSLPATIPLSRHPGQLVASASSPTSGNKRPKPASIPSSDKPSRAKNASEAFLLSLGLSYEDTRRAISRLPRLSTEPNLNDTAEPILSYLRDSLNLSSRQVASVVRHAPQILFRSTDAFVSRLEFLETVARIPHTARAGAIAKCPHILWMNMKTAAEVVTIVVDACPLITPTSLGSVFARVPQALITAPKHIHTNINRIREAGVCDAASMARIFAKAPLALVYDVGRTVNKRLAYLRDELHLPPTTVGKVLVATPEVLEWSVEKVLQPRVALLSSLVGEEGVPAAVDKVPLLLGTDDFVDRVLWLRETVGLNDAQLRMVVREAPAVLTYSIVGNLAPKWAFISETMGGTKDDVVHAPRETLCANLQQRAMPRYAFLASMGRHDVGVVDMLVGSDVEFCKNVARCEASHYREYVDNDTYLLFFSRLL